jgi:hypothetical protein
MQQHHERKEKQRIFLLCLTNQWQKQKLVDLLLKKMLGR